MFCYINLHVNFNSNKFMTIVKLADQAGIASSAVFYICTEQNIINFIIIIKYLDSFLRNFKSSSERW